MSTALPIDDVAQAAARAGVDDNKIEGILLSRSLRDYTVLAWPHIENDRMVWGWHMDAICEHLEAVSHGEITDLVINCPPGLSKSLLTSVFWQTWEWTWRPQGQWFFASYDQTLSTRDSVKCRNLIQSSWYQERWGHVFQLADDENLKTQYRNTRRGFRMASLVGGHGTGEHPDRIVIDDPHDRERAFSEAARKAAIDWWTQTMSTRGVGREEPVRKVIIMQRLHEKDLTAEVLGEGGWVHLRLPMRFEPKARCFTTWPGPKPDEPRTFADPRTEEGDLLCPDRYSEAKVAKEEKILGPFGTAGQLQQRPSSAQGGLFKRGDWRFWFPAGSILPPCPMHLVHPCVESKEGVHHIAAIVPDEFDDGVLSLDASVKDAMSQIRSGQLPDPVSMGAWGRKGPDFYLMDRVNGILDVGDTAANFLQLAYQHPWANKKIIEDKANGPAVFQLLRRRISGLVLATPQGDKVARVLSTAGADRASRDAKAMSLQAIHAGGNLWLPAPAVATFDVWAWIELFASFPLVEHDDDVDMTSMAILHLKPQSDREERNAHTEALSHAQLPPAETTLELHKRRLKESIERSINPRRMSNTYQRRR